MIKLATVSPCYNEEEVLISSIHKLTNLFQELIQKEIISKDSCIVLVNDGSSDRTWEIINEEQQRNKFVRGINLSYNVGHQNAIMAGMMKAKDWADAVITIDADLQDDIQAIPKMVYEFTENKCEVVYGVKTSRKADPVLKRMSAQVFYKLQHKMGVNSVFNHADFRLMSKKALNILAHFHERNLYLRALIPMLHLPSATVEDVIREREAGQSKYTLRKMLNLALDGITSFSIKPIYYILTTGLAFIAMSFIIGIYVLHALIIGTAYPGWASIMMSIWLIGGLMLLSIGIIGIYIGKIYTEVKQRPLYEIEDIVGEEN